MNKYFSTGVVLLCLFNFLLVGYIGHIIAFISALVIFGLVALTLIAADQIATERNTLQTTLDMTYQKISSKEGEILLLKRKVSNLEKPKKPKASKVTKQDKTPEPVIFQGRDLILDD
jgi:hypothetical protein